MQLMTIGYEGYALETFFNTLAHYRVETLVDVRELPISRKKGFAKTALREAAHTHNIHYIHMRSLGCPRPIRHDYRADKDWERYTSRYCAYLDTQDDAIAELASRVRTERCCLLCMEADPQFCHRRLVAERVQATLGHGVVVEHIPTKAPWTDMYPNTGRV